MENQTTPKHVRFNEEDFEFWKKKKDVVLEKKYSEIAPNIPFVNVSHGSLFLERIKKHFKELPLDDLKEIERWDVYEITRMFGKGLNPTSLKTTLNNVLYFVNSLNIKSGQVIRIVEFGTGSGWSTIMLRRQLKEKYPEHKIEIYSIDFSSHSIAATENSLDYCLIPWRTFVSGVNVSTIPNEDDLVTLFIDDFISFMNMQEDNYFDGFFSSHGTAYLSEDEYQKLLELLITKGKNNSVFLADSLDPLYTVNLEVPHLLFCSLFPEKARKMPEYVYGESLVSNSKFFLGKEVKKLIKVNNEESMLFYRWNNYLISRFLFKYLIEMLSSIRITTDVIEEYREDVYPGYLVNTLVSNNLSLNAWKILNDLPKCPLYITNCGFRLEK